MRKKASPSPDIVVVTKSSAKRTACRLFFGRNTSRQLGHKEWRHRRDRVTFPRNVRLDLLRWLVLSWKWKLQTCRLRKSAPSSLFPSTPRDGAGGRTPPSAATVLVVALAIDPAEWPPGSALAPRHVGAVDGDFVDAGSWAFTMSGLNLSVFGGCGRTSKILQGTKEDMSQATPRRRASSWQNRVRTLHTNREVASLCAVPCSQGKHVRRKE